MLTAKQLKDIADASHGDKCLIDWISTRCEIAAKKGKMQEYFQDQIFPPEIVDQLKSLGFDIFAKSDAIGSYTVVYWDKAK